MAVASNPLPRNASPSDREAAGVPEHSRIQTAEFSFPGTIALSNQKSRYYLPKACRIVGAVGFRKTAGGGGTTSVDILLDGTTILDATMDFAAASGANLKKVGVLETAHASYNAADGTISADAESYLSVNISAVEAAAAAEDLTIQVRYAIG